MSNTAEHGAQMIIRAWVERVLLTKGWKPYRLAKEAGLGVATIDRALDPAAATVPSTKTIEKIVRATGIAPPQGIGMRGNALSAGFAEPEGFYIAEPEAAGLPFEVTGQQAAWQINTRAIELAGCFPGDYVLVDPAVTPKPKDIVCAQIYSVKSATAETVFRVYEPPYIVTKTFDPATERKPELIDNERVLVWGKVVRLTRLWGD